MQCCREPGKTECHFLADRYRCPGVLSSCVTFQHPGSSSWDLHKQQCLCCCTFPRCVPVPELCPVAQCAPAGSAGAGMKSILTVHISSCWMEQQSEALLHIWVKQ